MRYSLTTAVSVSCTRLQEIIVWPHAGSDLILESYDPQVHQAVGKFWQTTEQQAKVSHHDTHREWYNYTYVYDTAAIHGNKSSSTWVL